MTDNTRTLKINEFLTEYVNKLHAARYTFHAVVKARYKVLIPTLYSKEQATEMYRMAMENYDGIIADAVSGACHDANQREMDKGFE